MAKRKIINRKYFFNPVKNQSTMTDTPTGTPSGSLVVEKNKDERHVILHSNVSTESPTNSSVHLRLDREIEEQASSKRTLQAKKNLKKLKRKINMKEKTLRRMNDEGKKNH